MKRKAKNKKTALSDDVEMTEQIVNDLVEKGNREGRRFLMEELQERNDLERHVSTHLRHSVMSYCEECRTWGTCFPYDRKCGNCGHLGVRRYYDEDTLVVVLKELGKAA